MKQLIKNIKWLLKNDISVLEDMIQNHEETLEVHEKKINSHIYITEEHTEGVKHEQQVNPVEEYYKKGGL